MLSFTSFCKSLGFPLKNFRWSRCALSTDGSKALFTIWEDEIGPNGRFVLFPITERRPGLIPEKANYSNGASEIKLTSQIVINNKRINSYGVICYAEDKEKMPRTRKRFNQDYLVKLEVTQENGLFVCYLKDKISTESFLKKI